MEEENILTDKSVRKKMFCNHCMFDCENYSKMKEHYQSEFHKYNLNRVTMNLNPLNYSEYVKKKEQYEKRIDEMNKIKEEEEYKEKKCHICIKKFSNSQKYKEHIQSKAHIKMENEQKRSEKEKGNGNQQEVKLSKTEKEKTTKDDSTVCLFCNCKNQGIEKNINHMVDKHQLDVPFLFCIRNYQKLIDLLSSKIFEHNACLTCNNQNFNSYRSLQNHMIDKAHTRINREDLEEYLYKLYDMKKLLNIKDTSIRKMNEFKILSLRHKVALRIKENNEERKDSNDYNCDDDEWEDLGNYNLNDKEDEEEKAKVQIESDLDYEPMRLPNGELLLEDGSVLGNKIYNIYYKQRIHISKYDTLQKTVREGFIAKRNQMKKFHRHNRKQKNIYNLKGSNKANFQRINNLFKVAPQV